MTKTCSKCKQAKNITEFRYRAERDCHSSQCRVCEKIKAREYRKTHPEQLRETHRKARLRPGYRQKQREYTMKSQYGLTRNQRMFMYVKQNGCCALCKTPIPYDRTQTDHNHTTGKVRGLLCTPCNWFVGWVETRRHLLGDALRYLDAEKEDRQSGK